MRGIEGREKEANAASRASDLFCLLHHLISRWLLATSSSPGMPKDVAFPLAPDALTWALTC